MRTQHTIMLDDSGILVAAYRSERAQPPLPVLYQQRAASTYIFPINRSRKPPFFAKIRDENPTFSLTTTSKNPPLRNSHF
ncbi:MAG TPA: hypothetical protein VGH19_14945 [Verrucomicrobiae bacterium]